MENHELTEKEKGRIIRSILDAELEKYYQKEMAKMRPWRKKLFLLNRFIHKNILKIVLIVMIFFAIFGENAHGDDVYITPSELQELRQKTLHTLTKVPYSCDDRKEIDIDKTGFRVSAWAEFVREFEYFSLFLGSAKAQEMAKKGKLTRQETVEVFEEMTFLREHPVNYQYQLCAGEEFEKLKKSPKLYPFLNYFLR